MKTVSGSLYREEEKAVTHWKLQNLEHAELKILVLISKLKGFQECSGTTLGARRLIFLTILGSDILLRRFWVFQFTDRKIRGDPLFCLDCDASHNGQILIKMV